MIVQLFIIYLYIFTYLIIKRECRIICTLIKIILLKSQSYLHTYTTFILSALIPNLLAADISSSLMSLFLNLTKKL